jgi:hypothetical protein
MEKGEDQKHLAVVKDMKTDNHDNRYTVISGVSDRLCLIHP